jgi:hypothetical protein
MTNPALDLPNDLSGRALVPASIEWFGRHPELDEQVIGVIWLLRLAALLAPQPKERLLVIAHDDAGVGASDKCATP